VRAEEGKARKGRFGNSSQFCFSNEKQDRLQKYTSQFDGRKREGDKGTLGTRSKKTETQRTAGKEETQKCTELSNRMTAHSKTAHATNEAGRAGEGRGRQADARGG
jgi:hypothetical protein